MSRIYLFKAGKLFGPLHETKIDQMKESGELKDYSWMMNEANQTWVPIEAMPSDNPFQESLKSLHDRSISGIFIHRGHAHSGIVTKMHSFGIELWVPFNEGARPGLSPQTSILMNLVDETHLKTSNAGMVFQTAVKSEDGVLLHFGWENGPVNL